MSNITILPTEKPYTFYLRWGDIGFTHYYDYDKYHDMANAFLKEVKDCGLKARLKRKYVMPKYYITFRSAHDAMAFKLRWS